MYKNSFFSRIKYVPDYDTTSELGKDEKKFQQIVVTMLYYAWSVDCTMLTALNITS